MQQLFLLVNLKCCNLDIMAYTCEQSKYAIPPWDTLTLGCQYAAIHHHRRICQRSDRAQAAVDL